VHSMVELIPSSGRKRSCEILHNPIVVSVSGEGKETLQ
jgi:hypothetical protein